MKVIGIFRKHQWSCNSSIVYFDQDEKKSRELDFRGIHTYTQDNLTSEFVILGEVKKSQSPWVVFKKSKSHISSIELLGGGDILCVDNLPLPYSLAIAKYSLTAQNKWQGYGIHETFKNPDQPSRWFSAFVATSKAIESSVIQFDSFFANRDKSEYNPESGSYLGILKPVVIIDGGLFGAELIDEQLVVSEIPYTAVKFEYKSPNYARGSYLVDLVSVNSLDNYIQLCEKQQQAIVMQILSGLTLKNQKNEANQKMTLEQALDMRLTWEAGMPFFTFFS
jgi:hypothetical protein